MRPAPLALAIAMALTLSVPPATAQEGPVRTITVTGTGEAAAAPDVATLRFSVVTRAPSAAEAIAENASLATTMRDRLSKLGVAGRDMQTNNLSLGPYYDRRDRQTGEQVIAGYEARNTLLVRLRDLDEAGAVIDAAVRAGANGLDGLTFGIEDQDALTEEAREDAVADAKATATLLAEAAGRALGPVVTITERGGRGGPQPAMMMRAESDMAPSTPIEGGEVSVTASVSVVYELE